MLLLVASSATSNKEELTHYPPFCKYYFEDCPDYPADVQIALLILIQKKPSAKLTNL